MFNDDATLPLTMTTNFIEPQARARYSGWCCASMSSADPYKHMRSESLVSHLAALDRFFPMYVCCASLTALYTPEIPSFPSLQRSTSSTGNVLTHIFNAFWNASSVGSCLPHGQQGWAYSITCLLTRQGRRVNSTVVRSIDPSHLEIWWRYYYCRCEKRRRGHKNAVVMSCVVADPVVETRLGDAMRLSPEFDE